MCMCRPCLNIDVLHYMLFDHYIVRLLYWSYSICRTMFFVLYVCSLFDFRGRARLARLLGLLRFTRLPLLLSMCIYMCIYIYIYVIHTYIYIYNIYIYICIHIYIYIEREIYRYVYMYMHVYIIYIYIYIYMYVHTYTHIYLNPHRPFSGSCCFSCSATIRDFGLCRSSRFAPVASLPRVTYHH